MGFDFFIVLLIYVRMFDRVAPNGKRIAEVREKGSLNFPSCTNLNNGLLLFSKFMKKGNIIGDLQESYNGKSIGDGGEFEMCRLSICINVQ